MLNALRLRISSTGVVVYCKCEANGVLSSRRRLSLRPPPLRRDFASFSVHSSANRASEPSVSSQFTPSVGTSAALQPSHWIPTPRHIQFLSYIACAAAISATWLFCAAIPTLLAFKRAAESMEKLMDATREELPSTMAAVRLSGMEISDLTMELSDIGQGITRGVRNSTRAVRLAEEKLRGLTNMNSTVNVQEITPTKANTNFPVVARTARGLREGIVQGRSVLQMFFALTRYSKILLNYFSSRAKA